MAQGARPRQLVSSQPRDDVACHGCIGDANPHNVAFCKSKHCEAANPEASGCNDKNICALRVETLRRVGNHCHDSAKEDGICVHGPGGPHILIANDRTVNNPRFGIHIGIASPHMLVARNVMQSKVKDLLLLDGDFQVRINGKGKQPPRPGEAELLTHKMRVIENTAGGLRSDGPSASRQMP